MLKLIIATLVLTVAATAADAGRKTPSCDPGFQWDSQKKRCFAKVTDDNPTREKCTPGAVDVIQEKRNGRTVNIRRVCDFM